MFVKIYYGCKYHHVFLVFMVITIGTLVITSLTQLETQIKPKLYNRLKTLQDVVPRNICQLNRTLVIVNGQVRTLVHVWEALFSNIILPNEPCDVILSIDDKRDNIPNAVLTGLRSHIIAILTTENERPEGLTEFWLTKRAIRKIHFDRYQFIIKTRTDLYHRIPICLRTIFGESDDFISSFHMFHRILMVKTARKNISAEETLYSWFMTAGMAEFIPSMLIRKPYSPWAKLHQHEWNKVLKSTLKNCTTKEKLMMIFEDAKNDEKVFYCFKLVLKRHKIIYNIGSTWIQFGHSKHIIPTAIKIADEFGTHTWAAVGYDDNDTLGHGQWKRVTESQMRLTFLTGGYNLIDLVNAADYRQTFKNKLTFQQAKHDKQFLFFVVRNRTIK